MRVLLIEDNEDDAHFIKEVLVERNHSLLCDREE